MVLHFFGESHSLLLFLISSIIGYYFISLKELQPTNKREYFKVLGIMFLSYPFLFALDRGNIEIYTFFLLYSFIVLFQTKKYALSSVVLSFAVALKLYPVIFVILFLTVRRIKEAIITIVLSLIIFSLFALLLTLFRGVEESGVLTYLHVLQNYNYMYAVGNTGLFYGHSLFGLLKIFNFYFFTSPNETFSNLLLNIDELFKIYNWSVLAVLLFLTFFIVYIEKEFWKRVALLIVMINLFPYVSTDYKLIHLFLPIYLFINKNKKEKTDIIFLIIFGLLLIPKNYYILSKLPAISLALILNPILMTAIILLTLLFGFKKYYILHKNKLSHRGILLRNS